NHGWPAHHPTKPWKDSYCCSLSPTIFVLSPASIQFVKATEVCLQEVGADGMKCVWFFYHHNFTMQTKDERGTRWKFSFSGFLVQRGANYSVILRNLPCVNQRAVTQVAIPVLFIFISHLLPGADNATSAQTGTARAEQRVPLQTSKQRRVLILYSLDHELYKNIVLRLAELLQHCCGVEVTLDLWEMHNIACIGHLQWLSYQMARIDKSDGMVLLLCSRGTMEKWRAHCGMRQPIRLCEDLRSPTGDLFTPALTILSSDFGTVSALGKYAVAYFKDVSKETDIPDVFRTLPTYHLMDHLEELFFRLHGLEQHSPGVTLHSLGISASDYSNEAFGERLQQSLANFQVCQNKNPDWFNEECRDKRQDTKSDSVSDPEQVSVNFCLENELVYYKREDVGPSINCFDSELSTRAVGNQLQECNVMELTMAISLILNGLVVVVVDALFLHKKRTLLSFTKLYLPLNVPPEHHAFGRCVDHHCPTLFHAWLRILCFNASSSPFSIRTAEGCLHRTCN
uniref:SEFIR domain-containing protein n=1 Tax=Eptatretus burgeri TaxID=7764 RepID=A0A8C4Q9H8_EPTBU